MALAPGCYPASVTPLSADGRLDLPGVAKLLAWFASNGCSGAVMAGTNGEGPSLSAPEKRELVRSSVGIAENLGLRIVLGVATPSLDEAVWLCKQAGDAGAAAVLLMPPGYFREAPEEGVARWFEAVLDASPLPILIYNFPKRTGFALSPELMHRLSSFDKMAGLKDSSGEAANLAPYRQALSADQSLYVGDETLLWQALEAGWTGTISGAANCIPRWLSQVVAERPELPESAHTKFEHVLPTIRALRSVPQPAGNKAILHELGVLESAALRLPLMDVDRSVIADALRLVRALQG
jgi:4-hydroxy-tetrahydrodipicolinate synthase